MKEFKEILSQYATVNENVELKTCTTLRVGGPARYIVYPTSILALSQCIDECKKRNIKFKVIGKGSNLLCSDKLYDGVIFRLDHTMCDVFYNENTCIAEAGASIISVAYSSMKEGLSGLEFASGIPGTVGGLTFMNAGAYKSSMKDVVREVLVYKEDGFRWLSCDECCFSYRHSIFHEHPDWVILAVKFNLETKDIDEIRECIENRRQRRMDTQPLDFPSAGSFFKNYEDLNAWFCIDSIGLRGKQIGGARVSEKHANFLINAGNATAQDFIDLIEQIQSEIEKEFGRSLIMEVEKFNWDE